MSPIIVVGWCIAGIAATCLIGSHLLFRLWLSHGDRLSRQFDELVRYRADVIDPIVMDPAFTEDEKREAIEGWLEMLRDHSQRRTKWAESMP